MDLLPFPLGLLARDLNTACLIAASTGVVFHLLYFIRSYRVPKTVAIISAHLAVGTVLLVLTVANNGLIRGVIVSAAASASYLVALFTSMTIYRLFFHPLRNFPGPLPAKISKIYNLYLASDGHLHENQTELVKQYGDIVRIAPNELLVVSLDALQKVHGTASRATKKQTFYDFITFNDVRNLDSILEKEEHRWRRQVWDKAFNSKALGEYEMSAREVIHSWLDKIAAMKGDPIDTSLYSMLIPFDNMGRMGFSIDFNGVKSGKENRMLHLIEVTFGRVGKLGQLTWPLAMAKDLNLSQEQTEFDSLACDLLDRREKDDAEYKEDIVKYFLEDYRSEKPKAFLNRDILYVDSQAIMIGGTDTIAAALAFAFYFLARDVDLRGRLREEVAPAFGKTIPGEFVHTDVSKMELLNAVIDETMRMHSPACNNGGRTLPPEGITVDGRYIPGGTTIFTGIHSFHRSPKYFKQPDEFIPERWMTRPDLVIDRRAFFPFSIGPYNCVGKRIAMIVLRLVLSYTVFHYDFEFAAGEDGTDIHKKSVSQLILKPGPLRCVFTKTGGN